MVFVGWILVVLGIGFLFIGFAGAVKELVNKKVTRGGPVETIKDLLGAITELVKALTAAPLWLATVTVGLILLGVGGYLIGIR